MLKNYFLIGLRNLKKNAGYSAINILGLGVGLAAALILFIWINHELSYDKFHQDANRIYRSSMEYSFGGQTSKTSVSPNALLPTLLSFPEVETGVRVYNPSSYNPFIVNIDAQVFQESHFYFADSSFFNVFTFPFIKGEASSALAKPYSVVLTHSTAIKYFGTDDIIGKTIRVNGTQDYVITGLIQDLPSNTILNFDLIGSFNSLYAGRSEPIWWSANYQTFFKIYDNVSIKAVEEKTNQYVKEILANELTNPGDYVKYNCMTLCDLYLKSNFSNEPEPVSDINYIYIFGAVALLIVAIAVINYVNLATARATDRAKEVGLRKVIGAVRNQLVLQFLGESLIITACAILVALIMAQLVLPVFNTLAEKNFTIASLLTPQTIIITFIAFGLVAVLAGAYPAFALAAFKPVSVLKGNFKSSTRGIWLRKSLVIFQFSISILLIVGTIVIVNQLNYLQEKNLGYEKENTIILPLDNKTREVYSTFKAELLRSGVVANVGRGNESPVDIGGGYGIKTAESGERGMIITGLPADEGYIPTLEMKIIAGRNFTEQDMHRADRDTVYSFIVNESALNNLFIPVDDAIGKKIEVSSRKGEIVGIVKDFHFKSLHKPIGPLVIFPESFQLNLIFVKLTGGNTQQAIEKVKSIYNSMLPHRPFEFEFVDAQYDAMYHAEQRMSSVFVVFASLAILIACLGLLGLVSFSATQKSKEIGIRKVLGASANGIVVLITRDYIKLVIVALVIAIPLSYYVTSTWLNNFAYKTSIGVLPFVIAGTFCLVIAFFTSSYHAIKAALLDPAQTLRNE